MKITNSNFGFIQTNRNPSLNVESKVSDATNISSQTASDSTYFAPALTYSKNPTHFISDFIQNKPDISLDTNKKADIVSELLKDELLISTAKANKIQKQEESKQGQFYGYSIDESGYMGEDFNAAAGLPSGFKLHRDTLEEIIERGKSYNRKWHEAFYGEGSVTDEEVFRHIDIANTIQQYYNVFTQIMPEIKESYSKQEVEELPKGFSDLNYLGNSYFLEDTAMHKGGGDYTTLEHFKVTNLYNQETYKEAKIVESQLSGIVSEFRVYELNFSATEGKSLYVTNDDTFSQEALFVSFLDSQNAEILEGGKTQFTSIILEGRREIARDSFAGENTLDSVLQKQALQNPEKLKELIKLDIQDSMNLLGKSKTFAPNEIAANFGGAVMDIYAFTQLKHYRSSLDSNAKSVDLTMQFTEAVHNNWEVSEQDIHNYAHDLYHRMQNLLHKTSK